MSMLTRIFIAMAVGLFAVIVWAVSPSHPRYWRDPASIREHLLSKTPLGSPDEAVKAWLAGNGVDAVFHRRQQPSQEGPLAARMPGSAIVHEALTHYWLPLRVTVEVFYYFDPSGRLVDVVVRKTTDGP